MNRQTLEQRKNVLGPEHPDTLASMNTATLHIRGKYEEAKQLNRQTLEQIENVFRQEHSDMLGREYVFAKLASLQ